MIIITSWDDITTSNISEGLKLDIKAFFKELVHDNLGEDYLTYDFTEIGKIAILEISDSIHHLPEIGLYEETIYLIDKAVEAVDDVLIDGIKYYRVTILLNDAEGIVLCLQSEVHGEAIEKWIQQGKGDMICNGL